MMQTARILLATLLVVLCLPSLQAQDTAKETPPRPAGEPAVRPDVPLKVQVTLSEFDGNQKISSLPYTIHTLGTDFRNRRREELRFGVRIPVIISSGPGSEQTSYQEVGTNIDCQAIARDEGQYAVDITIERSSAISKGADWKPGESGPGVQPILRHFKDEFILVMRDGQTAEGVSAVDPATGHVLKVDVTLNVAK
jgi:hypothetical protein